jgi:hypothetical protein
MHSDELRDGAGELSRAEFGDSSSSCRRERPQLERDSLARRREGRAGPASSVRSANPLELALALGTAVLVAANLVLLAVYRFAPRSRSHGHR